MMLGRWGVRLCKGCCVLGRLGRHWVILGVRSLGPNLPTRLETRTKESSMCASLKMVRFLGGMKVRVIW